MSFKFSVDLSSFTEFGDKMEMASTLLQVEVLEALNIVAKLMKADAEYKAAVKTGFMRSTVYGVVKAPFVLHVGAWAHYARFVEAGTRFMKAQPFIVPAVVGRYPKLVDMLTRAIKLAKEEAGL